MLSLSRARKRGWPLMEETGRPFMESVGRSPQRRAWLLSHAKTAIVLWPTLMAVFNAITLLETHTKLYHACSVGCLVNALALRHFAVKGNAERVRWLFLSFGLIQIFFFFQFWRKVGDICPPVHYYADPITNLYTVVPQVVMSDLPPLFHILFRILHAASSVSLYVHFVGHSLKLAILRSFFIHGCVCTLGYEYVMHKIQASYRLYLMAKQQEKEAGVAPHKGNSLHSTVQDHSDAKKDAKGTDLHPSKAGPAGAAAAPLPSTSLPPPNGIPEQSLHEVPAAPGKGAGGAGCSITYAASEPGQVSELVQPSQGQAVIGGSTAPHPFLHLTSKDRQPAPDSSSEGQPTLNNGVTAVGAPSVAGHQQHASLERLHALIVAERAQEYRSRLMRTRTTMKVYSDIEPEAVPGTACTDLVAMLSASFPGLLCIETALRHGCVVLSVEWASTKPQPVLQLQLGLRNSRQLDIITQVEALESQQRESDVARIYEAATHWADLLLESRPPVHGTELTVQVMGKLHRCSWDACTNSWVLISETDIWQQAVERPSLLLPNVAVPFPPFKALGTVPSATTHQAPIQANSVAAKVSVCVDPKAESTEQVLQFQAYVYTPASRATTIEGWHDSHTGAEHTMLGATMEQNRKDSPGNATPEQQQGKLLHILACSMGGFLQVDVDPLGYDDEYRQALQVTLHLPLHQREATRMAASFFCRVGLELWQGQQLLQTTPLLLVPDASWPMACELNAWCQAQSSMQQGGAAQQQAAQQLGSAQPSTQQGAAPQGGAAQPRGTQQQAAQGHGNAQSSTHQCATPQCGAAQPRGTQQQVAQGHGNAQSSTPQGAMPLGAQQHASLLEQQQGCVPQDAVQQGGVQRGCLQQGALVQCSAQQEAAPQGAASHRDGEQHAASPQPSQGAKHLRTVHTVVTAAPAQNTQVAGFLDDLTHWLHGQGQELQLKELGMLVELGLDLLEHAVLNGLVKVSETVLGLLLNGPYQLTFEDIALGSAEKPPCCEAGTTEREQLIQLAMLSGSVDMVQQVLAWGRKFSTLHIDNSSSSSSGNSSLTLSSGLSRDSTNPGYNSSSFTSCLHHESSIGKSISSNSSRASAWYWEKAGPAGLSPMHALCALPAPVKEQIQQMLFAEAALDHGLARALSTSSSLELQPRYSKPSSTQLSCDTCGTTRAAELEQARRSRGSRALWLAARCLMWGTFQVKDGVHEADYQAWCRKLPLISSRWLPFAAYLLLLLTMKCMASGLSSSLLDQQPNKAGNEGHSSSLHSSSAQTLPAFAPAAYVLVQCCITGAQNALVWKLLPLVPCVVLMLSFGGMLGSLAWPLLLQSWAAILSLSICALVDASSRYYYLYHFQAAHAPNSLKVKEKEA